nr:uncharacterized protein LOC128676353 [Plodia interpunctella]
MKYIALIFVIALISDCVRGIPAEETTVTGSLVECGIKAVASLVKCLITGKESSWLSNGFNAPETSDRDIAGKIGECFKDAASTFLSCVMTGYSEDGIADKKIVA